MTFSKTSETCVCLKYKSIQNKLLYSDCFLLLGDGWGVSLSQSDVTES